MKSIARKNVLRNGLIIIVSGFLFNLFLFSHDKDDIPLRTKPDILAENVSRMLITANGKETIISDTTKINYFLNRLEGCATPIKMRKVKVFDRYDVELEVGEKIEYFNFLKKRGMEFMLVVYSRGKNGHYVGSYACEEMEYFLNDYK